MSRNSLTQFPKTASLMLLLSGAVFACTMVSSEAADSVRQASLFNIRLYHALALGTTAGVIVIFGLRRGKGWIALAVSIIAVALSPGWFPTQNAGIDPMCRPSYAVEVKIMFAVTLICLIFQTALWKYRRSLS